MFGDGNLTNIAQAQQDYVVGIRRRIHQNPQVRWEEDPTLALIREEINALKGKKGAVLVIIENEGGLVVDLAIDPHAERILFRADCDALPIKENTGLPFASTNGCMHACGHDIHSAMLLGALRAILQDDTRKWRKNIRFVWQRAEENPITQSGGDMLVNDEGVCDSISKVYGIHILPTGEKGVIYSRSGALLGNSGRMKITIKASGGHVARPHNGVNALRVVQAVMNGLDNFAQATLGPTEPCSLEPVIASSGTASNVLPAEATLWYSVRTMLPRESHFDFMTEIVTRIRHIVGGYKDTHVDFERFRGHSATINDADALNSAIKALRAEGMEYQEIQPILGGEDFAHYLAARPGAFFMLGAGGPNAADFHTPEFNPAEEVFWQGVHLWLTLAAM